MAGSAVAPGVGTAVGGALGALGASFIPQLGSQVYAMAGMQTRLQMLADQPGYINADGRVGCTDPNGLAVRVQD